MFIFNASDYTLGFSKALGRADPVEKHVLIEGSGTTPKKWPNVRSDLKHLDVSFMLYAFVREMAGEVQSMQ